MTPRPGPRLLKDGDFLSGIGTGTMSAIVERYATDSQGRGAVASWTVEALTLAEAEAEWRSLEVAGLATPYQRHDWVRAYARHVMPGGDEAVKVIRIAQPGGRAVALLPLSVQRCFGFRIARMIGGKHANFQMPVMQAGFADAAGADDVRACLGQAAKALGGVDAFLFHCQPAAWEGRRNPFALLGAQPSPSQAYRLPLQADCEAALRESMSSHARKKHKNKRARFMELGPSRLILAADAAERQRILEAFLRQKAQRFAQMGVPDPFAQGGMRSFLEEASAGTADGAGPALSLYGLELNGAIVATYVGAVHGPRFSGMATSFALDPAVMKVSPGEILLVDVIRSECARGRAMFDLGVGEARYKTTICSETEELVDGFIAVSPQGEALAAAARWTQALKGRVKRSPVLTAIARKARGLRRGPPETAAA